LLPRINCTSFGKKAAKTKRKAPLNAAGKEMENIQMDVIVEVALKEKTYGRLKR